MALIKNAEGRKKSETPSGYERLFGNSELGRLISKCHATVITSGNELEKFLADRLTKINGVSIANVNKEKRVLKGAKRGKNIIIDIVIEKPNKIMLIELKDGDTFDTKKVAGEIESLILAKNYLVKFRKIEEKNITIHYCSFNAINHEQIKKGAKGLLPEDSAMTGKELCKELGLDFEKIVDERRKYQKANLNYFLEELLNITELKEKIITILKRS